MNAGTKSTGTQVAEAPPSTPALPARIVRKLVHAVGRRVKMVHVEAMSGMRLAAAHLLGTTVGRLSPAATDRLARTIGSFLSLFPPYGRSPRYERRRGELGAEVLAQSRISGPNTTTLRDFVFLRRILRNVVSQDQLMIEQRNSEEVSRMFESGTPFIVATGHFSRASAIAPYLERICPGRATGIIANMPSSGRLPSEAWAALNFGQMVDSIRKVRPEITFARLGNPAQLRQLIRDLRKPGNIGIIPVDTIWMDSHPKSHFRPFGGVARRAFPTGCARIARMSQCPVAVSSSHVEEDGTIVLVWRGILTPSDPKDADSDSDFTGKMLDLIERAVFERPDQYVLDVSR